MRPFGDCVGLGDQGTLLLYMGHRNGSPVPARGRILPTPSRPIPSNQVQNCRILPGIPLSPLGLGCSSQRACHQRCLSGLLSIHFRPCHWSQALATSAQVTEGSCVHESCVSLPSCPFQGGSCVVSPMPLLYSSRKEVFSTGSNTLLGVSTEETEGPLHSHIGRSAAPVFIS